MMGASASASSNSIVIGPMALIQRYLFCPEKSLESRFIETVRVSPAGMTSGSSPSVVSLMIPPNERSISRCRACAVSPLLNT